MQSITRVLIWILSFIIQSKFIEVGIQASRNPLKIGCCFDKRLDPNLSLEGATVISRASANHGNFPLLPQLLRAAPVLLRDLQSQP